MATFMVRVTNRDTGEDIRRPLVIDAASADDAEQIACDDGWLVRGVDTVTPGGFHAGLFLVVVGFVGAAAVAAARIAQDGAANELADIRAGVVAIAFLVVAVVGAILYRR